jgi:hypothetical protein
MSWKDQITTTLVIQTGDGKKYSPLWMNASKSTEFSIARFEFVNVRGTLVDRREAKGREFPLELYFEGADNLDEAAAFEASTLDPRPWVITHPYLGVLTVQPVSLTFDSTAHNVTKVTGSVIETITDDNPKSVTSVVDQVAEEDELTKIAFVSAFENGPVPNQALKNELITQTGEFYAGGTKLATGVEAEDYYNLFTEANAAITEATDAPGDAIAAVQKVIAAPASFNTNVQARLAYLQNQFEGLGLTVDTIVDKAEKLVFENNAGTIISSMCVAASTPLLGNYGTRGQVITVINTILANFNAYIVYVDQLQSTNGGNTNSYIPSADPLQRLYALVNFTISNLFLIALGAKQERTVYLEEDSNVITLAHRFYGLLADDSTIDAFIDSNGIGLNELLGLKKGRKVIYYV